ncbi:hypothetical protein I8J29_09680 [Paenibacillus sp. MWE-103]|uniref:Alpha-tubulin suppressor-like RCC1 family protein n=1 Tax=Paenibacillus artemisiicola TaxID=1172618 RepID=A0ABS3W824_9BACL|nr:stalk domain-containing protein [Paenibacillus artemisiicola]MBO7744465.1 hypothetical protein [Paenibacillus artemisiicola]
MINRNMHKWVVGAAIGLALMLPASAIADEAGGMTIESTATSTASGKLFADAVQIDSGDRSVYAVKSDGSLWAWGGGYGSIGNGATTPAYSPVQVHINHVKEVSGGYRHSLLLQDDGSVWAFGGNEHGQLGNGQQSSAIATQPIQVTGLTDMKMVSAGDNHSLALKNDGTVWGWGGNEFGQLGDDSRKNALNPVQVKGLPSIVSIAAGMYTSAALGNGGEVWVWGLETPGANKAIRKPTRLTGDGKYTAIAIDQMYGTALRSDGTVCMWNNQAWVQPEHHMLLPYQVAGLTDIVAISMGAAVKADGTVWQWSMWDADAQGRVYAEQVPGVAGAVSIASSGRNHYALLKDGHVLSWGTNEFGQTGLGTLDVEVKTPTLVKNSITVYLDGQQSELSMPPLLVHNSAYVPLRGIFEKMGVKVRWDVKTRSVIAANASSTIILSSLTGQTTIDGKVVSGAENPVFVNDSVYVPLRLISETLGAEVNWDADAYSISIED